MREEMKFLVGSQNFGLDNKDSDKDYMEFVYPDVYQLCRPIPKTKEVKGVDGSFTKVIDIRSLPSLFYKSNLDTLQLLYSKESTDNWLKDYLSFYEEELSTINLPRLYKSIMGSNKSRWKNKTSKNLAHIIFGYVTLMMFHEYGFKNLRLLFEHDNREIYQNIRAEKDFEYWVSQARDFENRCLKLEEDYMSQSPNEEFMKKLEEDIGQSIISNLFLAKRG